MEVSIKLPAVQAAVAIAGFMAFLAEVGAEQDQEQQAKTSWVLVSDTSPSGEAATADKAPKGAALSKADGKSA